ncbi:hypothetical protein ACHQM5_008445 [Ranunculus cassubicifolius]
MNSKFSFPFLLISLLSLQTSAFPNFLPNITQNPLNIPLPSSWESFKNLSGCHLGSKLEGLAKIKQYFHQFGYLPDFTNYTDDFDESLESALKTYQLNFNLNNTGVLDDSTLAKITLPRCGVADIINGTSTMKSGTGMKYTVSEDIGKIHTTGHYSFFPNQPRWLTRNRPLTYAFAPGNQLTDSVKAVFSRAFDKWAAVTPLTFQEINSFGRADITIGFYGGGHGDGEPFDGILGTLAHAFSPPDGRFHLDEAENWIAEGDVESSNLPAAVDLESVAVHEIGHLLGLGHSSVEEAIMFPTISTGVKKVQLASDDVEGIQVLYGSNPNYNGSDPFQPPSTQERESSSGVVHHSMQWVVGIMMGCALLLL